MWVIDKFIAHFFYNFHQYFNTSVWSRFSCFFNNGLVYIFIFFTILFFVNTHKKTLVIKFIIYSVIFTIYVFMAKWGFSRERPFVMLKLPNYLNLSIYSSFPSGHTTYAWLITIFVWKEIKFEKNLYRYLLSIILFVLAILVTISRVVILAHYPSDVIFSMLITFILYWVIDKFIFLLNKKSC